MKINQDQQFHPISIVLESREEARNFISMLDVMSGRKGITAEQQQLINEISNEFSGLNL